MRTQLLAAMALTLGVGCATGGARDRDGHGLGGAGLQAPVDPVAGAGQPRLLVDGFVYLEGPAWSQKEGVLLFVDQKASSLHRLLPPRGLTVLMKETGNSGGLVALSDGTFGMVQSELGQVSRLAVDGSVTVMARESDQGRLDKPNDLTVRADGTLYVTEPYTRQVVRVTPNGAAFVEWQGEEGTKPNGIGLSPDGNTLYVTDTLENVVRAFDVGPDGRISGERVFATGLGMDRESTWVTDGMAVDQDGNIYVASYPRPESNAPGEIAVFAANGARWGRIVIPIGPTNCTFGGPDHRTLYVTAQGALYEVKMPIPGLHP